MKISKPVNTDRKDLPYERFMEKGGEALSDVELLSILLQTGSKGHSVLALASQVLEKIRGYGPGLLGLHNISLSELKQIDGIGNVKAIKLKTVVEISRRIWQTDAYKRLQFSTPGTIAAYYQEQLRHERVEKVLVIALDHKMGYLGEKVLSQGTVNASLMSPREVFIYALQQQAVHLVLLHNHPSTDVTASKQDVCITRQIHKLGNLLGIDLLDHIIIGGRSYYSFLEHGMLTEDEEE